MRCDGRVFLGLCSGLCPSFVGDDGAFAVVDVYEARKVDQLSSWSAGRRGHGGKRKLCLCSLIQCVVVVGFVAVSNGYVTSDATYVEIILASWADVMR